MNTPFAPLATILLSLTILATVTFFGGKHPFLIALLPILCAALLAATTLSIPAAAPGSTVGSKKRLFLVGVFLPAFIMLFIPLAQLIPLQVSTSQLVSPFWNLSPYATYTPISLNPGLTILHTALAGSYLAFALSIVLQAGQGARTLVKTLAVVIAAASFYGIFIFITGNHTVLWLPKTAYTDSLTATFINRNSFATLAGLGILASLAMALHRVGEISGRLNPRERWNAFLLLVIQQGWPWLLASLLCFLALILTNSRAGLVASAAGVLIFLASLAVARPPARAPILSILLVGGTVGMLVLFALGHSISSRLTTMGEDSLVRDGIYSLTQDIIHQNPVVGTGLGTFPQAFSVTRTPDFYNHMRQGIEHAHNTYLELTAELGYPAVILLGTSLVMLFISFIYGLRHRRRAVTWPALGLGALTLVLVHALFDFSLSVPAVTLVALTATMLGLIQSVPTPSNQPVVALSQPLRTTFLAFAALLFLVGSWQSLAAYHAVRATPVLQELEQERTPTADKLTEAESHLRTCMAINPLHPTCQFGLARISLARAVQALLTKETDGHSHLQQAKIAYTEALAKAPANTHAWFRLARIEGFMGNRQESINAMVNSLLTGPNEPNLALKRIPVMLNLMPSASQENQSLFRDNILALWRSIPWDLGKYVRENPNVQKPFAQFLGNTPQAQAEWKKYIYVPYPL